jgi:hypothetical protein
MKRINFKRLIARNNRLILAYEKKYAKEIWRAFQKQLKGYLETGILSNEITPILTDMYMKVGERFYLDQYKLLSDISQKNLFLDAFKIWWMNYVNTVLAEKVTRINETTLSKLQSSLGDLIPQSLEFEEMADRLMKDFDFSLKRAMTISRTEVGNAMNEAKFRAKDNIKEELGEEIWKIWIHRGAKNPRDWHVKLDNGKAIHEDDVWRVEVPSTGGTEPMSRPHDPTASAENVINCGCEVMYISYSYAKNNGMI